MHEYSREFYEGGGKVFKAVEVSEAEICISYSRLLQLQGPFCHVLYRLKSLLQIIATLCLALSCKCSQQLRELQKRLFSRTN